MLNIRILSLTLAAVLLTATVSHAQNVTTGNTGGTTGAAAATSSADGCDDKTLTTLRDAAQKGFDQFANPTTGLIATLMAVPQSISSDGCTRNLLNVWAVDPIMLATGAAASLITSFLGSYWPSVGITLTQSSPYAVVMAAVTKYFNQYFQKQICEQLWKPLQSSLKPITLNGFDPSNPKVQAAFTAGTAALAKLADGSIQVGDKPAATNNNATGNTGTTTGTTTTGTGTTTPAPAVP